GIRSPDCLITARTATPASSAHCCPALPPQPGGGRPHLAGSAVPTMCPADRGCPADGGCPADAGGGPAALASGRPRRPWTSGRTPGGTAAASVIVRTSTPAVVDVWATGRPLPTPPVTSEDAAGSHHGDDGRHRRGDRGRTHGEPGQRGGAGGVLGQI